MTKDDIIKITITFLLSTLFKPVIDAYLPSKEKIKIYFKIIVTVLFSYMLPLLFLVSIFVLDTIIDKWFIIKVLLFCLILVFNSIFDLLLYQKKKQRLILSSIHEDILNLVKLIDKEVGLSIQDAEALKIYIAKNDGSLKQIKKRINSLENKAK